MPKKPYFYRQGGSFYEIMSEARFDFRGGRNSSVIPDNLNPTELADCTNARGLLFGGLSKRTGSQRINSTALGAPSTVNGVFQWFASGVLQTVAISNGFLYYRPQGFGNFTQVDPGVANRFPNANAHFASFRAATSGAPLVLYITCGGRVYSWDGTATLTRIDGTNTIPAAELVVPYHTRLFMNSTSFPQFVFWSGVGVPDNFTPSTAVAGGSAMVDVMRGDKIVGLEVIMGSLVIATKESLVRFSGYSANDIQIAQDTSGISAEVGVTGDNALLRAEQVAFAMTNKGPYAVMEAGALAVGPWVEPDFDNMDRTNIGNVCLGYHQGRREVWYAYCGPSDAGLNKSVLIYNLRLQRWFGPFIYPFGIVNLAQYEDSAGDKWLLAGCTDGFVRHMDIGGKDDMLNDGSAGSIYTMTVELAPYFFSDGPAYQKTLRNVFLQGNLEPNHALQIKYQIDDQAIQTHSITDTGNASLVLNYRSRLSGTGRRVRLVLSDASATVPEIAGLIVEAYHRERP